MRCPAGAEAAEAELARVQAKLDALMMAFNKNGSLGMLQLIAHDSNLPVEIRLRALNILLPYERASTSPVITSNGSPERSLTQ